MVNVRCDIDPTPLLNVIRLEPQLIDNNKKSNSSLLC